MHGSVIFVAAALAAVAPAAAHASHDVARSVRLAEVSADPRDGADTIELRGLRGFTHLELRARAALVDIHELGLRMHDGRIAWLGVRARIAPGERRTIELPYEARRAEAVVVDYGDPAARRRDRTPARLELYGAALEGRGDEWLGGRDPGEWPYGRDRYLGGFERRAQVRERGYRRDSDAWPGYRVRPIAPDVRR